MRLPISILCLIACVNVQCQELLDGILPTKNGKVTYMSVDTLPNLAKGDLYQRARRWFVDTYRSKNAVVQIDDAERGELVGKGYFTVTWKLAMVMKDVQVHHTVSIELKEGRYRYTFTDFRMNYSVGGGAGIPLETMNVPLEEFAAERPKQRSQVFSEIAREMNATLKGLTEAMTVVATDDW